MNKLFSYVDYDRMSDDIYFLGGNGRFILKMNVSLAKKMDDGTRKHFYSEFTYDSKYTDKGQVVSIKRSYDYYMSLESLEEKGNSIMIRPQDMILLRSRLAEVVSWYSTNNVFAIKGKKLVVAKKPQPVIISGFPNNGSIGFEPIVLDWEDRSQSMGVRITLFGSIFSDITIDKLYGFVYIIDSFNMPQSAQLMLAYMGMPEYGTNRYDINTGYVSSERTVEQIEPPKNVIKERRKQSKSKSFFDIVDNM